jgi:hypothetical protein
MLQIVARLLGWQPPAGAPDGSAIEALAAAPPPGLVVARGDLGMPPPLLDPAALAVQNRARALAVARRHKATQVTHG